MTGQQVPPLEETQRESIGGVLAPFQNLIVWLSGGFKRKLAALFGLLVLGILAPIIVFVTNPALVIETWDNLSQDEVQKELANQARRIEGERIDAFIDRLVHATRLRLGASRSVARAKVISRDRQGKLLGIVDVFEDMDARTERMGARNDPLPLEDIEGVLQIMGADPGNPICTARNSVDYPGSRLREWLLEKDLLASAACPILDEDNRIIGLFAVSIPTLLEENDQLLPRTRDAALRLGGYVERSPLWIATIDQERERME